MQFVVSLFSAAHCLVARKKKSKEEQFESPYHSFSLNLEDNEGRN